MRRMQNKNQAVTQAEDQVRDQEVFLKHFAADMAADVDNNLYLQTHDCLYTMVQDCLWDSNIELIMKIGWDLQDNLRSHRLLMSDSEAPG